MNLSEVIRTVRADQGQSGAMLHAVVDLVLNESPVVHETALGRLGKLLAEERTSPKNVEADGLNGELAQAGGKAARRCTGG